jgi:hypothetical protein
MQSVIEGAVAIVGRQPHWRKRELRGEAAGVQRLRLRKILFNESHVDRWVVFCHRLVRLGVKDEMVGIGYFF